MDGDLRLEPSRRAPTSRPRTSGSTAGWCLPRSPARVGSTRARATRSRENRGRRRGGFDLRGSPALDIQLKYMGKTPLVTLDAARNCTSGTAPFRPGADRLRRPERSLVAATARIRPQRICTSGRLSAPRVRWACGVGSCPCASMLKSRPLAKKPPRRSAGRHRRRLLGAKNGAIYGRGASRSARCAQGGYSGSLRLTGWLGSLA